VTYYSIKPLQLALEGPASIAFVEDAPHHLTVSLRHLRVAESRGKNHIYV